MMSEDWEMIDVSAATATADVAADDDGPFASPLPPPQSAGVLLEQHRPKPLQPFTDRSQHDVAGKDQQATAAVPEVLNPESALFLHASVLRDLLQAPSSSLNDASQPVLYARLTSSSLICPRRRAAMIVRVTYVKEPADSTTCVGDVLVLSPAFASSESGCAAAVDVNDDDVALYPPAAAHLRRTLTSPNCSKTIIMSSVVSVLLEPIHGSVAAAATRASFDQKLKKDAMHHLYGGDYQQQEQQPQHRWLSSMMNRVSDQDIVCSVVAKGNDPHRASSPPTATAKATCTSSTAAESSPEQPPALGMFLYDGLCMTIATRSTERYFLQLLKPRFLMPGPPTVGGEAPATDDTLWARGLERCHDARVCRLLHSVDPRLGSHVQTYRGREAVEKQEHTLQAVEHYMSTAQRTPSSLSDVNRQLYALQESTTQSNRGIPVFSACCWITAAECESLLAQLTKATSSVGAAVMGMVWGWLPSLQRWGAVQQPLRVVSDEETGRSSQPASQPNTPVPRSLGRPDGLQRGTSSPKLAPLLLQRTNAATLRCALMLTSGVLPPVGASVLVVHQLFHQLAQRRESQTASPSSRSQSTRTKGAEMPPPAKAAAASEGGRRGSCVDDAPAASMPLARVQSEFERQRVPANLWRVTSANRSFDMCTSYPPTFVVPASASDHDVLHAADYERFRGRVDALAFYDKHSGGGLVRSAQPKEGLLRVHKGLQSFGLVPGSLTTTPSKRGTHEGETDPECSSETPERSTSTPPIAEGSSFPSRAPGSRSGRRLLESFRDAIPSKALVVLDLRDEMSAAGNIFKGGGREGGRTFPRYHCDLPNIHAVTTSFKKIHALLVADGGSAFDDALRETTGAVGLWTTAQTELPMGSPNTTSATSRLFTSSQHSAAKEKGSHLSEQYIRACGPEGRAQRLRLIPSSGKVNNSTSEGGIDMVSGSHGSALHPTSDPATFQRLVAQTRWVDNVAKLLRTAVDCGRLIRGLPASFERYAGEFGGLPSQHAHQKLAHRQRGRGGSDDADHDNQLSSSEVTLENTFALSRLSKQLGSRRESSTSVQTTQQLSSTLTSAAGTPAVADGHEVQREATLQSPRHRLPSSRSLPSVHSYNDLGGFDGQRGRYVDAGVLQTRLAVSPSRFTPSAPWKTPATPHAAGRVPSSRQSATSPSPVGVQTQNGRLVLVHCTDGWDRTSQVAALAQLLLDPHFRTIAGFVDLVEKEFVVFGHPFRRRLTVFHASHESGGSPSPPGPALPRSCTSELAASSAEDAHEWSLDGGDTRGPHTPTAALASGTRPAAPVATPHVTSPPRDTVGGGGVPQQASCGRCISMMSEENLQNHSPVFLQFLDATAQLLRRYPQAFEFTESFLILVWDLFDQRLVRESVVENAKEYIALSETAEISGGLPTLRHVASAIYSTATTFETGAEGSLAQEEACAWRRLYFNSDMDQSSTHNDTPSSALLALLPPSSVTLWEAFFLRHSKWSSHTRGTGLVEESLVQRLNSTAVDGNPPLATANWSTAAEATCTPARSGSGAASTSTDTDHKGNQTPASTLGPQLSLGGRRQRHFPSALTVDEELSE